MTIFCLPHLFIRFLMPPWAPFYLALVYLFHPVLGIIATLGVLVMVGLSVLQEILVRKSMKKANIKNSQNQRFVDSFMRNTEVINGMGMISAISDRFIESNNQAIIEQTRSSYYAGLIQSLIKPLQNVIQVLIYCAGAYLAMTEGFNVGLMVAASVIMGRGLGPLMQVMSSWRLSVEAKEAYMRLKGFTEFIDRKPIPMALPRPEGKLNVSGAFSRVGSRLILKNVSFELNAGEYLGLIGPSGAGKTTLCRLILGIWPSMGGKVYLDGANIFERDKDEIGRFMGYLPQEVELFPGTVAENIARLGDIYAKTLDEAIEISGISDLIEGLPQGLETRLEGETGLKLSGGQKQKIGLARAIYNNPVLLVLDEPTSNLDEQGEKQFLAAMENIKKNKSCTCIMVTHKPSMLQFTDKILVLGDGAVSMFGPRNDVFSQLSGMKT